MDASRSRAQLARKLRPVRTALHSWSRPTARDSNSQRDPDAGTIGARAKVLFVLSCLLCSPAHAQVPSASLAPADQGASAAKHFDPLGKPPSKFTLQLRNGLKAELPFDDKRDFDEAKRGFIAEPPYTQIKADAGHVAWDREATAGCSQARTSRASTRRSSARPC